MLSSLDSRTKESSQVVQKVITEILLLILNDNLLKQLGILTKQNQMCKSKRSYIWNSPDEILVLLQKNARVELKIMKMC